MATDDKIPFAGWLKIHEDVATVELLFFPGRVRIVLDRQQIEDIEGQLSRGERLQRSEEHRRLAARCAMSLRRLTDAEIAEVAQNLAEEVSHATD